MKLSSGKRLLLVLPNAPYPIRKNGVSVRYFPLLQTLCRHFIVDIAIIGEPSTSTVELGELENEVNNVHLVHRSTTPRTFWRKISAQITRLLPWGIPYRYFTYDAEDAIRSLRELEPESYDIVIWVGLTHYLSEFVETFRPRNLIVDAVDSVTLWNIRNGTGAGWLGRLKLAKVRRWESSVLNQANRVFFISEADADFLKPYLPAEKLQVLPNGVYFGDFRMDRMDLPHPTIGYLGNMSYLPNIDAVHRLVRVFANLKKSHPDLKLYVVGRDPVESIVSLASDPDIVVTGTVDDIWVYLNSIDVFVLPMALGAGQQNKLLEILYAGKPAVVSSTANSGVLAEHGKCVLIANSEADTVSQVQNLLNQPPLRRELGDNGREFVVATYSWPAIAQKYLAAIGGP